jgi:hypothetical protein
MPVALVVTLAGGLLGALAFPGAARVFGAFVSLYLLGVGLAAFAASRRLSLALWPGATCALIVIHVGYGAGFLTGLAARVVPGGADRLFSELSR